MSALLEDPEVRQRSVRAPEAKAATYDAIIIGSGMSGLTSAVILAKEGKRVLVLEQHYRPGGYLHSFYRKGGIRFDVGFHYMGGIEPGQVLTQYLDYCGVWDKLHFIPLDPEGYDDMIFPKVRFLVPSGEERYRERLIQHFPKERAAIVRYFEDLRHICEGFAFHRAANEQAVGHADKWLQMPAGKYFAELTADENLRAVLQAQNPLYGVEPRRAPMGMHALVTDSFMQNPYTVDGGGDAIAQVMVDRVRELGGEVRTRRRVTKIEVNDQRRVTGVATERGERFSAPLVVSCAHPKITLGLLPDGVLPIGYQRRVMAMEDGASTLSVFATTRADLDHYRGKNVYLFRTADLDSIYDNLDRGHEFVFATVPSAREGRAKSGVHQVIGVGFMDWRRTTKWAGTRTAERGQEYEDFKNEQAHGLLDMMCDAIPELRGNVESMEAATPLTNRDYAGSVAGAAYGLHHTVEQTGRYGLRPRTKVGGLYLAGQSVLFPGVFGVTISAFYTCSLIFGSDYLMRKVNGGV